MFILLRMNISFFGFLSGIIHINKNEYGYQPKLIGIQITRAKKSNTLKFSRKKIIEIYKYRRYRLRSIQ